jgi:type II restriction enzyme
MTRLKIKIEEAQAILTASGVPLGEGDLRTPRRQRRLALALLSVADVKPTTPWSKASIHDDNAKHALATREIISFWNEHYGENLSSGSYDDVRRKDLVWLVEAGIVLESAKYPDASRNDPTRKYAVAPIARDILQRYGLEGWSDAVALFRKNAGDLKTKLDRQRTLASIPVTLPDGSTFELSPGPHNKLQQAIIQEFLPRYGFSAEVLYLGDSTKKLLHLETERLSELGFFELAHDMLPDVVAYSREKHWLYLIEAVHSANPINRLRHIKLERLTAKCIAPRVYVSVFKDRLAFRKWVADISWETEVWIADSPDHLIHFNGEKFLGPFTR